MIAKDVKSRYGMLVFYGHADSSVSAIAGDQPVCDVKRPILLVRAINVRLFL
jgi:hypothetical protein